MSAPRPTSPASTPLERLATLAGAANPADPAYRSVSVTGVTHDSRAVQPGDLYAALPGARVHGAAFLRQAAEAGAAAALTDPAGALQAAHDGVDLPLLVVPDPRSVMGVLAAQVYGTDERAPATVGITGTNGKTTTAYLLTSALERLGETTGLIGTVETRIGDERLPSARTTPEATDLHALLALMTERGLDTCVMEVSSHALVLHRVDGLVVDLALFTNLSQDHLDFHDGMEDYFAAKASLFTPARSRAGLVCVDDDWGARLATGASVPVTTLTSRPDRPADWRVERVGGDPSAFTLTSGDIRLALRSALPGDFNIVNTAMAAVALTLLGHAPARVADAILADPHVPGRMERVTADQTGETGGAAERLPLAVVDYAHTPDAIAAAVAAIRPHTPGTLVLVTGAGGDRDRGKRHAMGQAAGAADVVVVTDDNPRSEDPAEIRAAVRAGVQTTPARIIEVGDRRAAVTAAVDAALTAGPGSCVLVVGKGHEGGQEVAGVVHPFDDRVVLRDALAAALRAPSGPVTDHEAADDTATDQTATDHPATDHPATDHPVTGDRP